MYVNYQSCMIFGLYQVLVNLLAQHGKERLVGDALCTHARVWQKDHRAMGGLIASRGHDRSCESPKVSPPPAPSYI